MTSTHYDILIVGAGLVGTSLAAALCSLNLKIAILDHSFSIPEADERPISLSYSSQRILAKFGVWEYLNPVASPIQSVFVSQEKKLGAIHFHAHELEVPALGYVVPFAKLQAALHQKIAASQNIEMISIQQILSLESAERNNQIHFIKDGCEHLLSADLLIAADGTHSTCRSFLNISVKKNPTLSSAIIANVELQQPHQHIAFERFTQEGTLALLPLAQQHRYRLVWTLPCEQAGFIKTWDLQEWRILWNKHFESKLGLAKHIEFDQALPIQSMIADRQIFPGGVLLGNAAHTIYPLAAQGFNLGLRDADTLAGCIRRCLNQSKPFDQQMLETYRIQRENDQNNIIRLTQTAVDIFGLQLPLMNTFKGLGLLAIDLCLPLKRRLARKLMGFS